MKYEVEIRVGYDECRFLFDNAEQAIAFADVALAHAIEKKDSRGERIKPKAGINIELDDEDDKDDKDDKDDEDDKVEGEE